jgi:glycopeptide antibiotics resistance protein
MSTPKAYAKNSLPKSKKKWKGFVVWVISVLLILFMTLYPFNFSYSYQGFFWHYVLGNFYHPSDLNDFIVNVCLFIPFGFNLTYLLYKLNLKWLLTLGSILLASFSLSFIVESLQAFLPSRSSTISDLIGNTMGGFIGLLCLNLANSKLGQRLGQFFLFSRKGLTFCLISYTTLILALSIPVPRITNLNNWNLNFPLSLANETTGDNPWQGEISELYLADRALEKEQIAKVFSDDITSLDRKSIVAHYQLIDKNQYNYQDLAGNSPSLLWQTKDITSQFNGNKFFDRKYWLSTEKPATVINNKIRQTSQFTLITTVATADPNQSGPARIISLSGNHLVRNFALAQEGSSLVFRLRTPVTTEDGTNPHLVIPGVFTNGKSHRIVVTYSNLVLKLYIDNLKNFYYLEFTPLNAIISYLIPYQAYTLNLAKGAYFSIIFIPIGLCVGAINNLSNFNKFIFLVCSTILPTCLLEFALTYIQARNISIGNIILSFLIMFITIFASDRLIQNSQKMFINQSEKQT